MHGKRGAGEWEGCPQQGLRTRWLRRPKGRSLVLTVNQLSSLRCSFGLGGWLLGSLTRDGDFYVVTACVLIIIPG